MGKIILFDWANVLLDCYSDIYSIRDAQRDIAAHLRPENAGEMVKFFRRQVLDLLWVQTGRFDKIAHGKMRLPAHRQPVQSLLS